MQRTMLARTGTRRQLLLILLLAALCSCGCFQVPTKPGLSPIQQPLSTAPALLTPPAKLVECHLGHLPAIIELGMEQFRPTCKTPADERDVYYQVLQLFLPKLLLPWLMRSKITGLVVDVPTPPPSRAELEQPQAFPSLFPRPASEPTLIGFVDLSLQPQTLQALLVMPEFLRGLIYGQSQLKPYLCNLVVAPAYRKRGHGRRLVQACLDRSKEMGHGEMFLHVEEKERPAMGLYTSMGFRRVTREGFATLMAKSV